MQLNNTQIRNWEAAFNRRLTQESVTIGVPVNVYVTDTIAQLWKSKPISATAELYGLYPHSFREPDARFVQDLQGVVDTLIAEVVLASHPQIWVDASGSPQDEVYENIRVAVNRVFAAHLSVWQKQVSKIEVMDREIAALEADVIPMEKIERELAEAIRKDREKDIARAERRLARAVELADTIAGKKTQREETMAEFDAIREAMVPIRKMEHVVRYLPAMVADDTGVKCQGVLGVLGAVLLMFPEVYDDTVGKVVSVLA